MDNLVDDYFDDSHGRSVRRRYFAFDVPRDIQTLGFTQMKTIIATETISSSKYTKETIAEWRYYLTDHDKLNSNYL